MDANPYASPTIDADDNVPIFRQRKRGPLSMAVSGLFAGGFIGATAGALAAGTLGLIFWISLLVGSDRDFLPDAPVVGAIAGAILGGFSGCVIGPVVGIFAAISLPSRRRGLAIGTGIASSFAGAGGGLLGGSILADGPFLLGGILWPLLGAFLGVGFGAVGGYVLGRGLSILAWGKVEREARE